MQRGPVPITLAVALAVGAGVAGGARAQTTTAPAHTAEIAAPVSSKELIGATVTNDAGDRIGTIDSLLLDSRFRVTDAVVDVGGFLGIGAKSVKLPMDKFVLSGARVSLPGATKESLESAPEYKPLKSALENAEVRLSGAKTRAEVDRTVREWRSKIDGFSDKAADKTAAGYRSAKDRLDAAWDRVEIEWGKAKSAGREGWDDAQKSFDEAVTELERVWQEVAG